MLGMAICNILTGIILTHIPGWDPVFYIYGGMGIVWWLIWNFVTTSYPDVHPFISDEEAEFLKAKIEVHEVTG